MSVEAEIAAATSAWWMPWIAPLPFVGFWVKMRMAQNKRIADAFETAADAMKKTAELELTLAECRLDVERKFASKEYLGDVEGRLTKRIVSMEKNLINVIKG